MATAVLGEKGCRLAGPGSAGQGALPPCRGRRIGSMSELASAAEARAGIVPGIAPEAVVAEALRLSPRAVEIARSVLHAGRGEDSAALIEALGAAASDDHVASFRPKRQPEVPGT